MNQLRVKKIEAEVMNHLFDEKEADGQLARDTLDLDAEPVEENGRSLSM